MPSFSIHHATVVTVDDDGRVLHDATVTVTDGVITGVMARNAPAAGTPSHPGNEQIDARGAIVMPALINAHTHLAMTMFRGFADDMDLQGFLDRLFPVEARVLTADTVRLGARLAFAESFRAGCTTALDMFWWPEITMDEATSTGFDVQAGPVFIGFPGPDRTPFDERIRRARQAARHDWVLAHGTYTMQPGELDQVGRLAQEHGARFHIHAAENQSEVDDVRSRHGCSPVELLDRYGLLRPGTVLAHAVVLTDAEIARIAETGTAVAHCPLSNLKLASGVCRVPDLLAAGVTIGLGTDGSASSNDLDLFIAMRVAALLQKGTHLDARLLPAAQVLRMGTIDAARALGIDRHTGSIEVGKRADLVMLDAESTALTPAYDPVSAIVYSASRADVTDVWSAGRRVVRNRTCTTIDVPSTLAAIRILQRSIAG